MGFHFAALNPYIIFKLSGRGIEGVADSDINIFVCLIVMMSPANHDFLARRGNINADMIKIALMMMVMVGFDCNFAAHDM